MSMIFPIENFIFSLFLYWVCWFYITILWLSLGFSVYKIMSSLNIANFTSSFQFWCLLFFIFSWLISLSRISITVLNRSSGSGYPCLVPDFRGKVFNSLPLIVMLGEDLSYMAFIMLNYVISMPNLLRVFIMSGCWFLWSAFSAIIEAII